MGICPCRRDAEGPKEEELQSTLRLSTEGTGQETGANDEDLKLAGRLGSSYRISSPMKRLGSMRVYCAEHLVTRQSYVIKQVPKNKFRFPTQAKAHLFKTLSKLDHPHVIKTFEVCEDATTISIISEPCEGSDLNEFLATRRRLSQVCAATAMYQVLSALAYSHSLGVTHKSLCLESIVLKEPAKGDLVNVKVTGYENFELLRGERPSDCFLAPEVASGEVSEKCDIWSCGVILYVLLSGVRPFENSQLAQSRKVTYRDLPFPPEVWGGVKEEVISLITSMVSLPAAGRPSALECLAHSWLREFAKVLSPTSKSVVTSLSKLRTHTEITALQETITLFIINRVMKNSELAQLADIFTALDLNGDGVISRAELIEAFSHSMSQEKATQVADRILTVADRNQNGSLAYSEFLLTSIAEHKLLSRDNLHIVFSSLDEDGNGSISAAELKHFFKANTSPESEAHWKDLVAEFAVDTTTDIDFQKFEKIMTKVFRS